MTAPTIVANGLTKRYGEVAAVDDVSLRIAAGEIYALLGLNGAGKTTTIRMLLGMVLIMIDGRAPKGLTPHRHRVQSKSGNREPRGGD